ncbi:MAG: sulfatase-like hydrolase/transferase [Phycisphaerales bacterium]|nr:sulfatase-like hydrolase/transferase [Phycisphaerales bacterium]
MSINATVLSILVMAMGVSATEPPPEPKRPGGPNIVVIVSDDAGYADFGFTGATDFHTPNLDALAASGAICTQGYVTASVCSPSRAGLVTGRYQQRFGYEMNLLAGRPDYSELGLPVEERTIAEDLQAVGYRTAALGKWHLGGGKPQHPMSRGFDSFYGYLAGSRSYWAYPEPKRLYSTIRGFDPADEPEGFYVTEDLGREASGIILQKALKPFFIYLCFTAVHTPMHAQEEDLARYPDVKPNKRRKLAAMTWALDEAVGRIMETLEATGKRDNTLIFFINDNGGATNNASDNGVFRGMKGSKWEGGIRVPFLVSWPGHVPAGTVYSKPVSALDIVATSLAAAGVTPERALDGVDLIPYLDGSEKGAPHEYLFWRRGPAAAVRHGQWKLIRIDDGRVLLLDVENDPGETTDQAADHPEVVAQLQAALTKWESGTVEMMWTGNKKYVQNQRDKHKMDVQGRDAERTLP